MTVKSSFFNSVNGDRKYSATEFAQYFASFIGNGVFPTPSNSLQVMAGTNMTTVVKAGKGWINGYFVVNDSDYILQHDIADGVLKRIDRVVMRLNYLTRQIEIAVKKGTSASNPVAPTLQRDADFVELALADVYINNGATAITQVNITDTRLNNNLCGVVHGTVDQVDTTTIFNQYQAWFNATKNNAELDLQDFQTALENSMNQWMQQEQQDFETWFATIQDILDENIAATLAGKITTLEQTFDSLQNEVDTHSAEDAVNAHKASNISVVNPETSAVEDLQTFAQQLFTSVSNGKELIGTAITDVDTNVIVPNNATFVDLANAIGEITTGKKIASGTVSPSVDTLPFEYYSRNTAGSLNATGNYITVSGMTFKPSMIIVSSTWESGGYNYLAVYQENDGAFVDAVKRSYYWRYSGLPGLETSVYKANAQSAYVTDEGFRIPVVGNYEANWIAFE